MNTRELARPDGATLLLRENSPPAFRGVLLSLHGRIGADSLESRRSLR